MSFLTDRMKNKNTIYKTELYEIRNQKENILFNKFKNAHNDTLYIDTLGEQKHELMLTRSPSKISHKTIQPNQSVPVLKNTLSPSNLL